LKKIWTSTVLRQHIEKFAIVSSHWLQGCE
jgi:hypothetical protein